MRAEIFPGLALGQFREVLRQLLLGIAPGKIGVRVGEAQLGQPVHDLGPRECFGKKYHLRMPLLDLADHPFPEGKGLGVRVVDAEYPDALFDPVVHDALQLFPELPPVRGFEIERVDVLVLLGWILRVLDRPIRAAPEPFRMLPNVRMVGRALVGDVERHVDAVFTGLLQKPLEILQRPELRVDGLVAAFGRPDGPYASRIVRAGSGRAVLALAMRDPPRMDGRKVRHVKPHRGHVGEALLAIPKSALPVGKATAGAREHLVPGARPRSLRLHSNLEFTVVRCRRSQVGILRDQRGERRVEDSPARRCEVSVALDVQLSRPPLDIRCIGIHCPLARLLNERNPDQKVHGNILTGLDLLSEVAAPRLEVIDPGLERILVVPHFRHPEAAAPAVVRELAHGRFVPGRPFRAPVAQYRRERVVAVSEDIRSHHHLVTHDALDGKSPAFDLGLDAVDHHARRS